MPAKGIFTISLDFELHWGGFEKWPLEDYRTYFLNTRKVIPSLLKLFEENEVHVTWATVGILFHDSKQELMRNFPPLKPGYRLEKLSAYHFIKTTGIGEDESDDPFHFAPSLVKQIKECPGQELGSHTFAHYYCNEEGQTINEFKEDLKAAQRAAEKYSTTLQSLVFPRNQFNEEYLKACFQQGIKIVRSNPLDWFWKIESTQSESLWKRLNRGLDAYVGLGKENVYSLESLSVRPGLPVCLPASRLLRPYRPKELMLNDWKISRIKKEMSRAASKGLVYHLWWHPHNFGNYPSENLEGLKKILNHYRHCHKTHGMESYNMGEIADIVGGEKYSRAN
jgi:peptidoglycan/xylan/chitin deacetylase (PgdA/CDA1 family)